MKNKFDNEGNRLYEIEQGDAALNFDSWLAEQPVNTGCFSDKYLKFEEDMEAGILDMSCFEVVIKEMLKRGMISEFEAKEMRKS